MPSSLAALRMYFSFSIDSSILAPPSPKAGLPSHSIQNLKEGFNFFWEVMQKSMLTIFTYKSCFSANVVGAQCPPYIMEKCYYSSTIYTTNQRCSCLSGKEGQESNRAVPQKSLRRNLRKKNQLNHSRSIRRQLKSHGSNSGPKEYPNTSTIRR